MRATLSLRAESTKNVKRIDWNIGMGVSLKTEIGRFGDPMR